MNNINKIKQITIYKAIFFGVLLSIIFLVSCKKDTNSEIDFRDGFVGTYISVETILSEAGVDSSGMILWVTDTIAFDKIIKVEKYMDSSLNVIIDNYNIIATFEENNKFICLECEGPRDYVDFNNIDKIHVYRKLGVTNSSNYYGEKQ